jgi:hypothetical protein
MSSTDFIDQELDLNKVTNIHNIIQSNITFNESMNNENSRFDIMKRDLINAAQSPSVKNSTLNI